jgi:hypothetical protein
VQQQLLHLLPLPKQVVQVTSPLQAESWVMLLAVLTWHWVGPLLVSAAACWHGPCAPAQNLHLHSTARQSMLSQSVGVAS